MQTKIAIFRLTLFTYVCECIAKKKICFWHTAQHFKAQLQHNTRVTKNLTFTENDEKLFSSPKAKKKNSHVSSVL